MKSYKFLALEYLFLVLVQGFFSQFCPYSMTEFEELFLLKSNLINLKLLNVKTLTLSYDIAQ